MNTDYGVEFWVSQATFYLWKMYIREKPNPSGIVSVQIISKAEGSYKVVKTIGSSKDVEELKQLKSQAHEFIKKELKLVEFDFAKHDSTMDELFKSITSIKTVGSSWLLDKVFNSIGFNELNDELFKVLSIYRVVYPFSKLKMRDYLERYEQIYIDEDAIYRHLDKLSNKHIKRQIQAISYTHTLEILGGEIKAVFFDVTTLYFEIKNEDELRKTGFSKDGKHQNPQIVLGLLLSEDGYPLGYEIFKGNKFEGQTMMPILNLFRRKYKLQNLTVVADAGLLSTKNLEALEAAKYGYILGARIKNMTIDVQQSILQLKLKDGESASIKIGNNKTLLINYSLKRATKDNHNRARGVDRLEAKIKSGKLTKAAINNKGYNKFLKIKSEVKIELDKSKVKDDKKWDGLKGYITNTTFTEQEILSQYKNLWKIERAFRINKTELQIRPIYHRLPNRIEAHIGLCFVAYKIYMELERKLKLEKMDYSVEKFIGIAKSIYTIEYTNPSTKVKESRPVYITKEHLSVKKFIDHF